MERVSIITHPTLTHQRDTQGVRVEMESGQLGKEKRRREEVSKEYSVVVEWIRPNCISLSLEERTAAP